MKFALSLALSIVYAVVTEIPPMGPGMPSYVLYDAGEEASEWTARETCQSIGGNLAHVSGNDEFVYLSSKVTTLAYIDSWNTDSYGDACIAFYAGGAIAVPLLDCTGPYPFLCEVCYDGECADILPLGGQNPSVAPTGGSATPDGHYNDNYDHGNYYHYNDYYHDGYYPDNHHGDTRELSPQVILVTSISVFDVTSTIFPSVDPTSGSTSSTSLSSTMSTSTSPSGSSSSTTSSTSASSSSSTSSSSSSTSSSSSSSATSTTTTTSSSNPTVTSSPGMTQFLGANNTIRYTLYDGSNETSFQVARAFCGGLGQKLATIDDSNLLEISANIPTLAFIGKWRGNVVECLAAYNGGAVATPPTGCFGPSAFICEEEL